MAVAASFFIFGLHFKGTYQGIKTDEPPDRTDIAAKYASYPSSPLECQAKHNSKNNKYNEENGGGCRTGEDYGAEAGHNEKAQVL
jgi:hypothetical protein